MEEKNFLTVKLQIIKLKEKSLIIEDEVFTEKELEKIGYFSLISSYKGIFKNPVTKTYYYGVCFEDILSLYKFDEELRSLFFQYILKIEKILRSYISYYFCEKYGSNQSEYLNIENYNQKNEKQVKKLISFLRKKVNYDDGHKYIIHYRDVHGNIPLWVLINSLSFGTISKIYSCMKNEIRVKISKKMNTDTDVALEIMLKNLTKFRNLCAHGERLYNAKTGLDIRDTKIHEKLKIDKINNEYVKGKSDLFSVVIIFKYLLPKEDFVLFKQKLSTTINRYVKGNCFVDEKKILVEMGFPNNWKNISRYKI